MHNVDLPVISVLTRSAITTTYEQIIALVI